MKSPHLSHQVGWLRLADINLCPWSVSGEWSSSTSSCCSSMCKSLEPRSWGTDLLRDRISDDEFWRFCGIISFCRLLVVSKDRLIIYINLNYIFSGYAEHLQFECTDDKVFRFTLSGDKLCCGIAVLIEAGSKLTRTAHLNWTHIDKIYDFAHKSVLGS